MRKKHRALRGLEEDEEEKVSSQNNENELILNKQLYNYIYIPGKHTRFCLDLHPNMILDKLEEFILNMNSLDKNQEENEEESIGSFEYEFDNEFYMMKIDSKHSNTKIRLKISVQDKEH